MTITQDTHVLSMWSTPLYVQDWGVTEGQDRIDKINTELRDLILEREARHKDPLKFGVISATKTSLDILRYDTPAIDWLRQRILDAVETVATNLVGDIRVEAEVDLIAEGWAVVYRSGASHRLHTHHESAWSGVYYIDVGGVGASAGHLQLMDPRPAAIARQASTGVEYVEPRPGLMVVFPSWLPHSVKATLFGGGTRICIAFNVGYQERISNGN